jgi:hypothetical protein
MVGAGRRAAGRPGVRTRGAPLRCCPQLRPGRRLCRGAESAPDKQLLAHAPRTMMWQPVAPGSADLWIALRPRGGQAAMGGSPRPAGRTARRSSRPPRRGHRSAAGLDAARPPRPVRRAARPAPVGSPGRGAVSPGRSRGGGAPLRPACLSGPYPPHRAAARPACAGARAAGRCGPHRGSRPSERRPR